MVASTSMCIHMWGSRETVTGVTCLEEFHRRQRSQTSSLGEGEREGMLECLNSRIERRWKQAPILHRVMLQCDGAMSGWGIKAEVSKPSSDVLSTQIEESSQNLSVSKEEREYEGRPRGTEQLIQVNHFRERKTDFKETKCYIGSR